MTRTTNARIAGFTYLFYAAIGICIELLMGQARGSDGGAAELVRIGQYATNVRLSIRSWCSNASRPSCWA